MEILDILQHIVIHTVPDRFSSMKSCSESLCSLQFAQNIPDSLRTQIIGEGLVLDDVDVVLVAAEDVVAVDEVTEGRGAPFDDEQAVV